MADRHPSRNRRPPQVTEALPAPPPRPEALTCHRCKRGFNSLVEVITHMQTDHLPPEPEPDRADPER